MIIKTFQQIDTVWRSVNYSYNLNISHSGTSQIKAQIPP